MFTVKQTQLILSGSLAFCTSISLSFGFEHDVSGDIDDDGVFEQSVHIRNYVILDDAASLTHGSGSIASGAESQAVGANSLAFGPESQALYDASLAVGSNAVAGHYFTTSLGDHTMALSQSSVALGYWNFGFDSGDDSAHSPFDTLLEIGNGDETSRGNALTVFKNGQTTLSNKSWLAANGQNAWPAMPAAIDDQTALVVEGDMTLLGSLNYSGGSLLTIEQAGQSFLSVDDNNSLSLGEAGFSGASPSNTLAWGTSNAKGNYSSAWGRSSDATRDYATAWGWDALASGKGATAWGRQTKASAYLTTAIGQYNIGGGSSGKWKTWDSIFEVGIGTSSSNRINGLTVRKDGKVLIGAHDQVSGLDGFNETMKVSGPIVVSDYAEESETPSLGTIRFSDGRMEGYVTLNGVDTWVKLDADHTEQIDLLTTGLDGVIADTEGNTEIVRNLETVSSETSRMVESLEYKLDDVYANAQRITEISYQQDAFRYDLESTNYQLDGVYGSVMNLEHQQDAFRYDLESTNYQLDGVYGSVMNLEYQQDAFGHDLESTRYLVDELYGSFMNLEHQQDTFGYDLESMRYEIIYLDDQLMYMNDSVSDNTIISRNNETNLLGVESHVSYLSDDFYNLRDSISWYEDGILSNSNLSYQNLNNIQLVVDETAGIKNTQTAIINEINMVKEEKLSAYGGVVEGDLAVTGGLFVLEPQGDVSMGEYTAE